MAGGVATISKRVFWLLSVFVARSVADKSEKNNVYFYRHRSEWKLHMVGWVARTKTKISRYFGRAHLFAATAAHQMPSNLYFCVFCPLDAVRPMDWPGVVTSKTLCSFLASSASCLFTHYKNVAVNVSTSSPHQRYALS